MVPLVNGRQSSGNFDQAFGQQRVPDIDHLPRLPLNGKGAGRLRGGGSSTPRPAPSTRRVGQICPAHQREVA